MNEPAPGDPAVAAAGAPRPARAKRPRVIAPPQHLQARVQLIGSYAPVPHTAAVDESTANARPAKSMGERTRAAGGDPLAGLRAKDDDPRLWGDATEDLAEAMKREKPPHWG